MKIQSINAYNKRKNISPNNFVGVQAIPQNNSTKTQNSSQNVSNSKKSGSKTLSILKAIGFSFLGAILLMALFEGVKRLVKH